MTYHFAHSYLVVNQSADEETNKMIAEMLTALATFQERAREKDPLKAKAKMRFIIGMKQVWWCSVSHKYEHV